MNKVIYFCCIAFLVGSCKKEKSASLQTNDYAEQRQTDFETIRSAWDFNTTILTEESSKTLESWQEWQDFTALLQQKPTSTMSAFIARINLVHEKSNDLLNNIPEFINNQQVIGRIKLIQTEVNNAFMYLNLNQILVIPANKSLKNLKLAINSFEQKVNEIHFKAKIPIEEGELEMLQRLKDTSRAAKSTEIKDQSIDSRPSI